MLRLLLTLAVAGAGGLLARRVRLPGGVLVGAMLTTAAVSQIVGEIVVPEAARSALFIGVGVMIGTVVTRTTVRALRFALLPALASAALLVVAGIGVALLLRFFGVAPAADVLATSPGALSVLTAAAVEQGHGAATVALFHVTRVLLVMLSLPLLTRLLPAGADAHGSAAPTASGNASRAHGSHAAGASGRARTLAQVLLTAAGATAGGLALATTGIGGSLVLGSTVGAAAVTLAYARPRRVPDGVITAISVGIGWMVGALVTPETIAAMPAVIAPALVAAGFLIAAGIIVAFLLRAVGHAPPGDVLATSPGAMEALSATAVRYGTGPLEVGMFHIVRVLLVIVSLPLLIALAR